MVVVSAILAIYVLALVISAFVAWRVAGPHGRSPAGSVVTGTGSGAGTGAAGFYLLSTPMDGVMLPETAVEAATAIACADLRRDAELAVERYYLDTSRYPPDLNALFPAYLNQVPSCPDGVPFYVANNVVVCPLHGITGPPGTR